MGADRGTGRRPMSGGLITMGGMRLLGRTEQRRTLDDRPAGGRARRSRALVVRGESG